MSDADGPGRADESGASDRSDASDPDRREEGGDEATAPGVLGSRQVTRRQWHLAAAVLALTSFAVLLFGSPLVDLVEANDVLLLRLAATYGFLLGTSGFVVAGALRFAGAEPAGDVADTGRAVGKIENVLVLTLTLLGAFTALAIVFTAKSIVRWQDLTSENTTYYLTGSIANVTYSFVYGLAAVRLLGVSG